jgi:Spy/CpxP family protein refolding chaperone
MKIFSLPVIIGAVGAVAIAGGLLVYATSGYTSYQKPHPAPANVATDSGAAPSTDGSAPAVDNNVTPSSNGSAPQANGGGWQGGNGYRQRDPNETPEQREQRRQQRMQQMAAALGLTDAQKAQMEQIRQTVTDRAQRRAAIMAILTPEQQAKMQQMRANGGSERHNRDGNGGAPGGTANTMAPAGNTPATATPPTH